MFGFLQRVFPGLDPAPSTVGFDTARPLAGKQSRVLLLALLLSPGLCRAQAPADSTGPQWVVEQYLLAPAWPLKAEYYSGEMKARDRAEGTIGEAGVPVLRSSLHAVESGPTATVFTALIAPDRRPLDLYLYVVKEDAGWRLSAIRALWLPPLFYMLLDTLANTPGLSDSDAAELQNMRLTVSTDSALKTFFHAHQPVLDSIAEAFGRDTVRSIAADEPGRAKRAPARAPAAQLAELHLKGVKRTPDAPGCVLLGVGGMIDNEVGFMRCAGDARPPAMSVDRFILVDAVAPGWYLYKTT
ncbi:MAG TPA: hypothetical protein VJQ44_16930 [Gemmatimonadales bacterium]|nr:hypothetical protein [Gemmatimonadales bacterium]